jgi:hypothetical protein
MKLKSEEAADDVDDYNATIEDFAMFMSWFDIVEVDATKTPADPTIREVKE